MRQDKKRNPLITVLAIIGGGALLYLSWNLYQRQATEQRRRSFFSATPAPGMPDLSRPEAPPPQP